MVIQNGIAYNPYFVQWIAIISINHPESMHKKVIEKKNHVIEKSSFKGWRIALCLIGRLFISHQIPVSSKIQVNSCATSFYIFFSVIFDPKHTNLSFLF